MNLINKIESLLLEEFKTVPFHNVFMLNNIENNDLSLGGTCSDKVLHFREVLKNNGIETKLHSSFINNVECHRMLSVLIDKKKHFIDIGSGWPSLKLFPELTPIEYSVYGMSFKTEIFESKLIISHKTGEVYKQMIDVPIFTKSETDILCDIENRFKDISIYPFQNSLRFSIIKDDSFYFIKGDILRIYNETERIERKLDSTEINNLLQNKFGIKHLKSPR
ncbi:hypothetical protein F6A46_11370 [Tenacibaculum finnmarkense genomovar ulcerans]|uniref:hypothetical protein n=1 Tax=Tenacibaculum finnmarkense TaxID=2781243 RepID=UPI00187B25D2|nr:hypothetical protein [Tenacibaculum finnmarkense]MBE7688822.1 hypothetical protein [Tenacibaculum finnmarkense genomovar ulcerans]